MKISVPLMLNLEVFFVLLDKKVHTRKELAEKFEVSQRTISRYIDNLKDARVFIETIQGCGGGYQLSEYAYKRFSYYANLYPSAIKQTENTTHETHC